MGKNKNNKVSSKETNKTLKLQRTKMKQNVKKSKKDHIDQIPFRLREIMKSQQQMKVGSRKRRKTRQGSVKDGDIPVPHFKRRKDESEKAFVGRMEEATKHVLFLTQNQVDRKPELEPDQQENPAEGKSEKKKQYAKDRSLKMQQRKLDKQETNLEKEMFVDDVPFGEVTMAPPSLTVKPRKAQEKSQSSKDLLLHSLLGQKAASSSAKPSMARQRIMEEERQRVVEAYRNMKKQKQQMHNK